jgi:hypothetical protein
MSAPMIQYITIAKVSRYTSARYIAQILFQHKIAVVRCIKFIPFKLEAGHFKRAIIHVASWMKSPVSDTILHRLESNGEARVVHKAENAWSLVLSSENEKNTNARECVFFKMHNILKSEIFKGGVQEAVLVQPVGKLTKETTQYVFYNEPRLLGEKINWNKKTPLAILEHITNAMEVLESEEQTMIKEMILFTMMCESDHMEKQHSRAHA